jgi:hypothetical protein
MKIRFTKLQAGEIAHKACIVRDDEDLRESYELTEEQAEEFAYAFLAAELCGGEVEVQPEWADVIDGEIENALEIAQSWLEDEGPTVLSYIRSMRQAANKVRQAFPTKTE